MEQTVTTAAIVHFLMFVRFIDFLHPLVIWVIDPSAHRNSMSDAKRRIPLF